MKKIKFKSYFVFPLIALMFCVAGCETLETDLTDDPSRLGEEEASLEFVFNANQLQLANFFQSIQFEGAQVCRMELMGTSPIYLNQFSFGQFDGTWSTAYSGFLRDARLSIELAEAIEGENTNGNNIIAAVQIMESYILTTLVDYFGDIPYSEALQGSDNFNPSRDDGEELYAVARALLENSINLIQAGNSVALPNDFYYGGDMSKWEKLANSLLLRLTIQSRLENGQASSQFNALINSGDLMSNNNDDFQFNYSTTREPVDSRHPLFGFQYDAIASFYQSQDYMDRLEDDPRFNYYFNQQDASIFGRVHGDAGPPVASELNDITVYGLYPVGGEYNDGSFNATGPTDGAAGAGSTIIMTNFATQFYLAEGLLAINGNVGAARNAMIAGITASMDKVTSFNSTAIPTDAIQPTSAEINDYIAAAGTRYDNATSNEAKLDVVITEFYKSLWGNGIDVYNNYRRTSYPSDVAPSTNPNPGSFTNSMWYPAVYVNNNNNADAQQRPTIAEKIWWAENTSFNLDF